MEEKLASLSIADKKSTKDATVFASKSPGLTGAYTLQVKPGTKVYRYDVEIIREHPNDSKKNKIVTKRGPDDGEQSLRRVLCMEVVSTFQKKSDNFGINKKGEYYVYDGGKQLYLAAPMSLEAGKKRMVFANEDLSPFCQKQIGSGSIIIEICPSQQHEIDISNVKSLLCTRENPGDRSVAQFLDLLTSQYAVSHISHVSLGLGKLYQRKGVVMDNHVMELKTGLNKGIQPIEKDGKFSYALVVDAKKSAFYTSDTLSKILIDCGAMRNRNMMRTYSSLYNEVRCILKYAQNRSIVILGISDELAKNVKVNGGSLAQFFEKQYNVKIDPNLPVVRTERAVYPMDTLLIAPNQRVPMEKLDDYTRRQILMGTAVLPSERFKRIREEVDAAKIISGNPVMDFFNVKASQSLMEVPINVRTPPTILGAKQANCAVRNAAYQTNGLFIATPLLQGGFVVLYPNGFQPKSIMDQLTRTAAKLGLTLGPPVFEVVDFSNYSAMMTKFKELMEKKTRFCLAFDYAKSKSHHNLKLLEREFQVLTMQIKIESIQRSGGIGQTLENLVLKINAKASGINVIPVIEKCGEVLSLQKKVLVIGIDISLPPRGSAKELFELRQKDMGNISSHEPAVVGITANCGRQPTIILGDYYYQQAAHEVLDSELLNVNFSKIMERFVKARGTFPEHVVILRDGVGEGQLHRTTQSEYPIFENVCRQMKGQNQMPGLMYIVVTKKHNKRFATGTTGKESNCVPGSVVDRVITRPDIPEFYLQAHRPIKGTAKSAHYSVMMNPQNIPMDAVQAFCNCLCFNHQIVSSAVSLPEPVYHAKEMTKRGRNNLAAKRSANGNNIPRQPNGLVDFPKVSASLGYANIGLCNTKFAA